MRRDEPRIDDSISPEQLQFLAAISPTWECELAKRQGERERVHRHHELQRFVDSIIEPDYSARGRQPRSDEAQRFAAAITGRDAWSVEEETFDPGKHPRLGGPPNAGWFARTGPWANRAHLRIALASGKNWSGDRVLDVMGAIAPGWVPFIQKQVTLARTSSGENKPETIVRVGENGPDVRTVEGGIGASRDTTVHFHIPDDWNDAQVVQYILDQMADHTDVHRLARQFADLNGEQMLSHELFQKRFKNGLPTIVALAQGYYKTLAGLVPGGGAAVAVWDIEHGDHLGAALGTAFMIPLGKLAKGIEAGGTIAIRAGEKVIALLPVKVIQRIQRLAPEQQALLQKRLMAATSLEEAGKIVHEFLRTPFDHHHPLAKFLGGNFDQALIKIPRNIHKEFHAELLKELRAAGITLPVGTSAGSTKKWRDFFLANDGSQAKAFEAILKASKAIDDKHGTTLLNSAIINMLNKDFTYFQ